MIIAIDLTPLHGRKWTGVELYGIDLYRALLKTKHTIVPIFHGFNDLDDNSRSIIIPLSNRIVLENFKLSMVIRKLKADIVLFPIFPPPIDIYINSPSKIVPVIHDTAFIDHYSTLKFAAKYYLTPKYKLALRKSSYIVTISGDAKLKIERYSSLPILNWKENISYEYGVDNLDISKSHLSKMGLEENSYYISVSTIEPRKNLKYLLKSIRKELELSNKKLFLVGRRGWGKDNELNNLLEEMSEKVIFTGYIPLNIMQSLYHYAYAFVLLSVEEGFGRTPLEAIACGCKRIIVSDIPVFHEILHNSANYIELNNEVKAEDRFIKNMWLEVRNDFHVPFDDLEKNMIFL